MATPTTGYRLRQTVGVMLALILGGFLLPIAPVTPVAGAEQARFCITVTSAEPIDGDILEAVAAGRASLTVESAAACASEPEASSAPVEVGATTGGVDLSTLRVEPEDASGYSRKRFQHWVGVGGGCNTRRAVLIEESLTPVTVGSGCSMSGGSWISVFDGHETTDPTTFDIDHVVPLKEAWRSDASEWSPERRRAFANDLTDARTLRAVSASSNRSKGDRDPADWLPPDPTFHCQYAADWVAIKSQWDLSVDEDELEALTEILADCPA